MLNELNDIKTFFHSFIQLNEQLKLYEIIYIKKFRYAALAFNKSILLNINMHMAKKVFMSMCLNVEEVP